MRPRIALAALAAAVLCLAARPSHALTLARAIDNIAYQSVHNLGYTGSGQIIAVIDLAYVRTDHRTFWTSDCDTTSRVTKLGYYGGSTTYAGHANAVAGIAAGRGKGDGTYLGVAPGAEVWSASTSGKDQDMRQPYLDFSLPDCVTGKKCQIYAMSLAAPVSDCGLFGLTLFMDWMAVNRGALIAFGAGNVPGYIAVPGGNYNHITVAGLDVTKTHPAALGNGPTFDGRAKPDIIAPATGLYLPDHVGVDAWYYNSGSFTSNAVPFVAGAAALVKEYGDTHGWTWDPRVAKAVILNGATKLDGWTHTDTQPLDYYQGAGRLNAEWTIFNYAAGEQAPGAVARRGWDIELASNKSVGKYNMSLTAKSGFVISATLDWWRHTVPTDDNLLGYNWAITKFENLQLYLYRNSDCAVVAQSVSSVDSVEHIFYHVATADTYSLGVQISPTLGATRTETYALAWNTLVPGDANGDGKINGADLAIWQQHYDPLGAGDNLWTTGDWNWDGMVNGADLALWQQNYDPLGTGLGLPLTNQQVQEMLTALSVPEPAGLSLAALGLAVLGALRRRRRRS